MVETTGVAIRALFDVERDHNAHAVRTPPQEYEAGLGVMPAFLEWTRPKAPNPGRVPPAEAIEPVVTVQLNA